MRFDTEERYNAVVLKLKGDVMGGPDGSKLHDKLRELREAGQRNVIVDLSRVRFMNSSGLGMLIGGLATMRNAGGDLRLANPADRIQSLLMIAKLLTVFKHFESVDEAVESFTSNPPAPAPESAEGSAEAQA
jgi:anti-sigma B factor antagonist